MKPTEYNKTIKVKISSGTHINNEYTKFIDGLRSSTHLHFNERRRNIRFDTSINGAIHITKTTNEILIIPITIKNVSSKSMLVELRDKGHIFTGMLPEIESFYVSFTLEDCSHVTVECFPKRIELKDSILIGVTLENKNNPLKPETLSWM